MAEDIKTLARIEIILFDNGTLNIQGPDDRVTLVGLLEIAKARVLNPIPPKKTEPAILPYNGPIIEFNERGFNNGQ